MPNRRIHIILSAPVFLLLYSYTAVVVLLFLIMAYLLVVLLFLIMAYLRLKSGIVLLSGLWAKSIFPLMGKKVHIEGKDNIKKGERYILLANHAISCLQTMPACSTS